MQLLMWIGAKLQAAWDAYLSVIGPQPGPDDPMDWPF